MITTAIGGGTDYGLIGAEGRRSIEMEVEMAE
jgi:hypothetical protein